MKTGIPSLHHINKKALFEKPVHLVYSGKSGRILILKSFPISEHVGILAVQDRDEYGEAHIHTYLVNEGGKFLEKNSEGKFIATELPFDYFHIFVTRLDSFEGLMKQDMNDEVVSSHFRDI